MYLLLVDNNYNLSKEIKDLLANNSISCEVVNCSSKSALIDLASKISPHLVIIDFDLFSNSSVDIVKDLRRSSPGTYVMAIVDSDHYDTLNQAIEAGIDNYIVKPLQPKDLLLRIMMGCQQKGFIGESSESAKTPELQKDKKEESEESEASKKLFQELADLFGRQFVEESEPLIAEKKDDEEPSLEPLAEAESNADHENMDTDGMLPGTQNNLDQIYDELLAHPENDALPFDDHKEEHISSSKQPAEDYSSALDTDISPFDLNPEPRDETFENIDQNLDDPGLELIDEAFSLVENLPEEEPPVVNQVKSSKETEADNDLKYFDDLFDEDLQTEGPSGDQDLNTLLDDVPAAKQESADVHTSAADPGFDDLELFGMTGSQRSDHSSSFEDLFTSNEVKKTNRKNIVSKKLEKQQKAVRKTSSTPRKSREQKNADWFSEPETPAVKHAVPNLKAKTNKVGRNKEREKKGGSAFRVIGNVVTALLLIVMLTLSFFLIQSRLSGGTPAIAGYQMYVVLSGSMNPSFDTGSLVFVKPTEPSAIAEGDIITFSSSSDATRLTTHRVVGINQNDSLSFVTRGDANNVNDPSPVPAENVVGRVTGSVPYIGYLFGFAQTRQGLILLIFIPGLFLIIMELRRLFKYMVEAKVQQLQSPTNPSLMPGDAARAGSEHYDLDYARHQDGRGADHKEVEDFGI